MASGTSINLWCNMTKLINDYFIISHLKSTRITEKLPVNFIDLCGEFVVGQCDAPTVILPSGNLTCGQKDLRIEPPTLQ